MNKNVVLIVDDDDITRLVLNKFLAPSGATIYEAAHGMAAIEMLALHPEINLITLDLNMPVMDGYHFLEEVGRTGATSSARIYVTSASSKFEFKRRCESMNIDRNLVAGYFEKPYDMREITALVSK